MDIPDYKQPKELLDVIKQSLLTPRTITNPDSPRYPEDLIKTWPPKYQDLYQDAQKIVDPKLKAQALSYIELSIYEPTYSGELQVRKFQNFAIDTKQSLENSKPLKIIRFADTRLKEVNKASHLLGDYHMVATVREIQNALRRHGVDPHHGIKYYQHHGSFMATIDDQQDFDQITNILTDPIALNEEIWANNAYWNKFDNNPDTPHALPFIVATTHLPTNIPNTSDLVFKPITLNSQSDLEMFLHEGIGVLDHLKAIQIINETYATLVFAGSFNITPTLIQKLIEPLVNNSISNIEDVNKYIADMTQLTALAKLLNDLAENIYSNYIKVRPERKLNNVDYREISSSESTKDLKSIHFLDLRARKNLSKSSEPQEPN